MTYVDQKVCVKHSLYKNAKKSVIISINSKTSKSLTILSNQYKLTKYSKLKWHFQHILGSVEFIIFFYCHAVQCQNFPISSLLFFIIFLQSF